MDKLETEKEERSSGLGELLLFFYVAPLEVAS